MSVYVLALFVVLLIGLIFIFIVWRVPRQQVLLLRTKLDDFTKSVHADSKGKEGFDALKYQKDLIDLQLNIQAAETNARTTLAQIVGGVLVLLGLVATSVNLLLTYQAQQTKESNDRFANALSRLPDREFAVRLGGVYAMSAVDQDFRGFHQSVIQVLAAFARSQSRDIECANRKDPNPDEKTSMKCVDVQAAISFLASRDPGKDPPNWNLDLRELRVAGAELDRASFRNGKLSLAEITFSSMTKSDLRGADLSDGDFTFTDFTGSHLEGADLRRARFRGAVLKDVYFDSKTKLDQARFENAKLKCAHLGGLDLSVVQGAELTWEQVREADFDDKTTFPPGVIWDRSTSTAEHIPCTQSPGGER